MGVQLIFATHRRYRPSVAVWWYILVRLWAELFISQGLMQAFFGLFDGHILICCNIPCFSWKTTTWSKGNRDGKSYPHNCCLIIALRCSSWKFLQSGCSRKQVNKHDWTPIKYLNVLHHNRTKKQLRHSFLNVS